MSKSQTLSVPPALRRGGKKSDEQRYVKDGRDLLAYMCRALGLDSLVNSRVLDMGCGTKFTQAILEYDIPIGAYIGVDVYKEMIEFLRSNTADPRMSFHHVNTHNDMYNQGGEALSESTRLPIDEYSCDIICLFSVFTHLAPADYTNMLRFMRRYARIGAKLIFTLYLDEVSNNGHGLIEQIVAAQDKPWRPSGLPFRDAYPGKPLQWALYSREYAHELIAGTDWRVEELRLPTALAQHHFICQAI
jgi:SAM-dependent methyltransferase